MNRTDFFKKLIRYLLFLLLAVIGIALGNKAVAGNKCTECPGSGICKGESDCSKFLPDANGKR